MCMDDLTKTMVSKDGLEFNPSRTYTLLNF